MRKKLHSSKEAALGYNKPNNSDDQLEDKIGTKDNYLAARSKERGRFLSPTEPVKDTKYEFP